MEPQPTMQTRFTAVGSWRLAFGQEQVPRFARDDPSIRWVAATSFAAMFGADVGIAAFFAGAAQRREDAVSGVVGVGDDDAARVVRVLQGGADGVQRGSAAFAHALGAVVAVRRGRLDV